MKSLDNFYQKWKSNKLLNYINYKFFLLKKFFLRTFLELL